MIKLSFIGPQRKILSFEVNGKLIKYFDDVWKDGVQIIPKDDNFIRKLLRSGDMDFKVLAAFLFDANKGENLREYQACKTEEDIANKIRDDMASKGVMEVK